MQLKETTRWKRGSQTKVTTDGCVKKMIKCHRKKQTELDREMIQQMVNENKRKHCLCTDNLATARLKGSKEQNQKRT